jgi:hypothetical protein
MVDYREEGITVARFPSRIRIFALTSPLDADYVITWSRDWPPKSVS